MVNDQCLPFVGATRRVALGDAPRRPYIHIMSQELKSNRGCTQEGENT